MDIKQFGTGAWRKAGPFTCLGNPIIIGINRFGTTGLADETRNGVKIAAVLWGKVLRTGMAGQRMAFLDMAEEERYE